MNSQTPRIFIAATRQNDGKTTSSLGLCALLQKKYPRVGFIKPVGQRFVEIAKQKIDEDIVLMDRVYHLNCPLGSMSAITVEPNFTRDFLASEKQTDLADQIIKAFDRVAWEKDFVVCEGTGHAGVGSVFDLSNARVAKILKSKVILVTQGGIGKPIDEVALNQALFEKEGVEIIGVILNKVLEEKMDRVREFAGKGLKRRGLKLLGVIPHQAMLESPTMDLILEETSADILNDSGGMHRRVETIVVAAMEVNHAMTYFREGALIITPSDREDIIRAQASRLGESGIHQLAGMVLTGKFDLSSESLRIIREMPFPVLHSRENSYEIASKVHDLVVKTKPGDTEKINLIRDLYAEHLDIDEILNCI